MKTASQPTERLSLAAKIAAAVDAIGGIEKKGSNEHYHYKFVRSCDVAKAFRHELFSRGVIVTPDEKELQERQVQTLGGALMNYVNLKIEYTLRDTESAETIICAAYGSAMDTGDKAIYKAKTGAQKYFLRQLGIVPDEKDDPEADPEVDDFTDARSLAAATPKAKRGKSSKVADYQMRAFDSACHATGKTADQIAAYLRTKCNAASVADINRTDFQDAIKWALGKEALADTLKVSVQSVKTQGTPANGASAGD